MCFAKYSTSVAMKLKFAQSWSEISLNIFALLTLSKFCNTLSWVIALIQYNQAKNWNFSRINFKNKIPD